MAITRTQIAKQLLAQGGRIGLQGGGRDPMAQFTSKPSEKAMKTARTMRDLQREGAQKTIRQQTKEAKKGEGPYADSYQEPLSTLQQKSSDYRKRELSKLWDHIYSGRKPQWPGFSTITRKPNWKLDDYLKFDFTDDTLELPVEDIQKLQDIQAALKQDYVAQSENWKRKPDDISFEDFYPQRKDKLPEPEGKGGNIIPMYAQLGYPTQAAYLASLQAPSIMDQGPELTPLEQALANRTPYRFAAEGGIMNGGRTGYRNGNDVDPDDPGHEGEPLIIPDDADISPDDFWGRKEKPSGIMMASYDYNDAMAEAFAAYKKAIKDGIIPPTMEFDEYLELMQGKKETAPQGIQMAAQGGRIGYAGGDVVGGEFDFESARQMYGLGKLVKKITKTVKKIVKSPIGKAALIGGGLGLAGIGPLQGLRQSALGKGLAGFFGEGSFNPLRRIVGVDKDVDFSPFGELFSNIPGGGATAAILGTSLLAGALTPEQEAEAQTIADETGIPIAEIRANPDKYLARRFKAEGGSMKEPVAKKTMPLLDMGGKEMDLREEGGFVPIGRMEKADDVPARLSKNEFVFTADAVRNAGDGDVDKGAEVMYNMMKNLESGGDVSEESQGLEGARKMFQTSQRLGEVI